MKNKVVTLCIITFGICSVFNILIDIQKGKKRKVNCDIMISSIKKIDSVNLKAGVLMDGDNAMALASVCLEKK